MAHLDGRILPIGEARISPLDRGFLFGDAVYEAMPAIGGGIVGLDRHVARLQRSLREIGLDDPSDAAGWHEMLRDLVAANGGEDMVLYLQVSRGPTPGRDHRFPASAAPTVFAMAMSHRRPAEADYPRGIPAALMEDERWARCDIKSTSLLANVLARQRASAGAAQEAILTRDGWVTEGAASTIAIVAADGLVVPPPDHSVLPSVTLELVLDIASAEGIGVTRRRFTVDEMLAADEVLMLASIREIVPIGAVDGREIGNGRPGPVWRRLFRLYQQRNP